MESKSNYGNMTVEEYQKTQMARVNNLLNFENDMRRDMSFENPYAVSNHIASCRFIEQFVSCKEIESSLEHYNILKEADIFKDNCYHFVFETDKTTEHFLIIYRRRSGRRFHTIYKIASEIVDYEKYRYQVTNAFKFVCEYIRLKPDFHINFLLLQSLYYDDLFKNIGNVNNQIERVYTICA